TKRYGARLLYERSGFLSVVHSCGRWIHSPGQRGPSGGTSDKRGVMKAPMRPGTVLRPYCITNNWGGVMARVGRFTKETWTKSGRTRLVSLAAIGATLLVLGVPGALAVHDLGFQLDGDIAQSTPGQCGFMANPPGPNCPSGATVAPSGFDWSSFFVNS